MTWLKNFTRPPAMTHLVHGERGPLEALRARISAERQWPVHIAGHREQVEI
jgi:hypothetical protein